MEQIYSYADTLESYLIAEESVSTKQIAGIAAIWSADIFAAIKLNPLYKNWIKKREERKNEKKQKEENDKQIQKEQLKYDEFKKTEYWKETHAIFVKAAEMVINKISKDKKFRNDKK